MKLIHNGGHIAQLIKPEVAMVTEIIFITRFWVTTINFRQRLDVIYCKQHQVLLKNDVFPRCTSPLQFVKTTSRKGCNYYVPCYLGNPLHKRDNYEIVT